MAIQVAGALGCALATFGSVQTIYAVKTPPLPSVFHCLRGKDTMPSVFHCLRGKDTAFAQCRLSPPVPAKTPVLRCSAPAGSCLASASAACTR